MKYADPNQNTLALHKVKFYGGVVFDENGTVSLSYEPGQPDYFGTPSLSVEAAWDKLLNRMSSPPILHQLPRGIEVSLRSVHQGGTKGLAKGSRPAWTTGSRSGIVAIRVSLPPFLPVDGKNRLTTSNAI